MQTTTEATNFKPQSMGVLNAELSREWQEQAINFINQNEENFITVKMYDQGYNLIEIYTNRRPFYQGECEIIGSELIKLSGQAQLVLMDIDDN